MVFRKKNPHNSTPQDTFWLVHPRRFHSLAPPPLKSHHRITFSGAKKWHSLKLQVYPWEKVWNYPTFAHKLSCKQPSIFRGENSISFKGRWVSPVANEGSLVRIFFPGFCPGKGSEPGADFRTEWRNSKLNGFFVWFFPMGKKVKTSDHLSKILWRGSIYPAQN